MRPPLPTFQPSNLRTFQRPVFPLTPFLATDPKFPTQLLYLPHIQKPPLATPFLATLARPPPARNLELTQDFHNLIACRAPAAFCRVNKWPSEAERPLVAHHFLPILSSLYHTSQRSEAGRTMGESALQPKAWANIGKLDSGPITRYLAMGCGSPWTIFRCVSGRISSPRHWPQAMKNC